MTDPIAVWHAEHVRFARLLDFIEQQMTIFHDGGDPDYELMRDVLYYLHHYADRYHHPREDVAFARLVQHEPGLKFAVNRLIQEHRVMAAVGETLLNYLEDILEDTVIERETVEAAAATYLVYYRHHLNTEEREVLPQAARFLRPDDWAAVASAVASAPDPLVGDDVSERYRELRKRLSSTREKAN
ncbi:MAG TPA: hemerythrin domain-containing protein [Burkholderiales bacterium]|nr:hemerythrin domain-containing protein [Burkholderiales bacterium]